MVLIKKIKNTFSSNSNKLIIALFFYLKAIWKIIKALIPAKAVELVKFCNKTTIKEYVSDENLFTHMGGKVSFCLNINLFSFS